MKSHSLAPFPADFLCIGAQKACTTWLSRVLKSDKNNRIFIPYIKESFYLNLMEGQNDFYPTPDHTINQYVYTSFREITEQEIRAATAQSWGEDGITQTQAEYICYLCKSLSFYWTGLDADWYGHLFSPARADQLRGELTPDYSFLGRGMISSVWAAKPDMKVILLTRNPVSRDLSQLRMQLLPRIPDPSDEKCIQFLSQPHVRERSNYGAIVQRWTEVLGERCMLTLDAQQIATEPRLAIDRIARFLNVSLEIDDEALLLRDNISRSEWQPSRKVKDFLEEYYQHHDVYAGLKDR
jgi:hypothetical protein